MAELIEAHRQAGDEMLERDFDIPLESISSDLKGIDEKFAGATQSIHHAQVAVAVLEETSKLDSDGWARLRANLNDDFWSGEMGKRTVLTALKLPGATVTGAGNAAVGVASLPAMTGIAAGWLSVNWNRPDVMKDAIATFGKEQVDKFSATIAKLGSGDRSMQSDIISDIAGDAAGGELFTWGFGKFMGVAKGAMKGDKLPTSAGDIPEGGIPLDTPGKRKQVGLTEDADKAFQGVVDENKVRLQMERRNADAAKHEGKSYMKSEGQKDLKSLHEYNGSVGGPGKEASSLLGLFEPTPPPRFASKAVKEAYAEAKKVYEGIGKNEVPPLTTIAAKRAFVEKQGATVYIDGVKTWIPTKFDKNGILRNAKTGKPFGKDHDGWDTLTEDGSRSLGYNADGTKGTEKMQSTERRTGARVIKQLQKTVVQLAHSNRTRLWNPLPELKWKGNVPYFDCTLIHIKNKKAAMVAREGVVEHRPGEAFPYLTHAHGAPRPAATKPTTIPKGVGAAAGSVGGDKPAGDTGKGKTPPKTPPKAPPSSPPRGGGGKKK